jgi:hypothetical protein
VEKFWDGFFAALRSSIDDATNNTSNAHAVKRRILLGEAG